MAKQAKQNNGGKKEKKKIKRDVAKVLNKDVRLRRRLLAMNPYAMTLLDPFNNRGCRIPDESMYPSVPFTIVDRRTLVANANGVAMICYGYSTSSAALGFGSLIPIPIQSNVPQSYVVGMINGSAATINDVTAGVVGTTGPSTIKFLQWQASALTVPSQFDKVRLVSAGLNVQFTGNFTANSGKFTIGYAPRNYSRASSGQPIPITQIQALPDSRTVPISLNEGVTIRYEPVDDYSFRYTQIGGISGFYPQYTIASSTDWETIVAQACGGELWVTVDGAPANTTFQCTFVANYEGIPETNSFLLNGLKSTSTHDPIALTHALRVNDAVPNVSAGSFEANGTAMNTTVAQEELNYHPAPSDSPGMFDKLLGMLEKAPDFISKAGSAVEKVTPLLEGAMEFLA